MFQSVLAFLSALRVFFRSRGDTAFEVLALRQQVAVLKRKRPRPILNQLDKLFWAALRRCWPRWADVLVVVKPETVIRWHRAGFRLFWRWHSRARGGRPKITAEIRGLIRRLAQDNADWGAPKIHGERLKLGFHVSERTVFRCLRRVWRRGDPGKQRLAFLQNHREVIVAFDFFAQRDSALDGRLGDPRVGRSVSAAAPYRCVILDRDSKFDDEVLMFLRAPGLEPKRASIQSPWQNGTAERWVGSCRWRSWTMSS